MLGMLTGAVSEKIFKTFEEKYPVYTEKVYQNVKKPCFFVEIKGVEKINLIGGRFFLRVEMNITAENESDNRNLMSEEMAGKLFNALNFVEVGEISVYGRKMNAVNDGDKMIFKVFYDVSSIKENEEDETAFMESIGVKEDVCGIHKG